MAEVAHQKFFHFVAGVIAGDTYFSHRILFCVVFRFCHTKIAKITVAAALPGSEFMLFLLHEIFLSPPWGVHRSCWVSSVFSCRCSDAVSAALRRIVGPLFARFTIGCWRTLSGRCPQLPRKSRHTASRQDRSLTLMGNDALLRFAPLGWWAQVALLTVAVGVTWHILSFATLKKYEA